MAVKKKKDNIVKYYKGKKRWRIEHFIFLAIFIYLIFNIIIVLGRERTSVYQVYEGSIINDTVYTGIAIREETLYTSDTAGYIQYYELENNKIATGSSIYTMSKNELNIENTPTVSGEKFELTNSEKEAIYTKVQSFNSQFSEERFLEASTFKTDIAHIIGSAMNDSASDYLDALADQNESGVRINTSNDDGIIVYKYDGYEDFQEADLVPETFEKNSYRLEMLTSGDYLDVGDPSYKLVTSEEWCIYILLSDQDVETLSDTSRLKVNFKKDDVSMYSEFSIIKTADAAYGKLKFNTGMVRYAADRYLDLELVLNNQEGLKIPVSSVVEEEFYQIPADFVDGTNILLSKSKDKLVNENARIYYADEQYAYISTKDYSDNQVLGKKDTMETYTIKQKVALPGVYIVNRGYAVFQCVNIIASSEEYYIVEMTDNGLENYDHIALYGEGIEEKEIIF